MIVTKTEFNKLSLENQIDYFNTNLIFGHKITEICDDIGISYNTIRDRFSRNNYSFNKDTRKYELIREKFLIDEDTLARALEKVVTKVFVSKKIDNSQILECNLEGNVVNRSFRVYDNVLEEFTKFCSQSKYNQYDIISTFILEGIEKYKHSNK